MKVTRWIPVLLLLGGCAPVAERQASADRPTIVSLTQAFRKLAEDTARLLSDAGFSVVSGGGEKDSPAQS